MLYPLPLPTARMAAGEATASLPSQEHPQTENPRGFDHDGGLIVFPFDTVGRGGVEVKLISGGDLHRRQLDARSVDTVLDRERFGLQRCQ